MRMRHVAGVMAGVLALALLAPVSADEAHEHETHEVDGAAMGAIVVSRPWSRPALAGGNGVVYGEIGNRGAADDRLLGAASPVAGRAELHRSTMEDGIHRMEKLDGIPVPAGGAAVLQPGGLHLMLIGLKTALKAGDAVPILLTFRRAGDVAATVMVKPHRPAPDGESGPDGAHHGHGG